MLSGGWTIQDISSWLQRIGLALLTLAALLLVTTLVRQILRRRTRQIVAQTDLSAIGEVAVAQQAISRNEPGTIIWTLDNQQMMGRAVADEAIRSGDQVRIVSVEGEFFRVRPDSTAPRKPAEPPRAKIRSAQLRMKKPE